MKRIWMLLAIVVITPAVQSQVRVSAGNNFTCAITHDTPSRVFCWGLNTRGQLGIGSTVHDSPTPKAIHLPKLPLNERNPFIDVSAGRQHACALTTKGKILCWGDNVHQQLGFADADFIRMPRLVEWPALPALPKTFEQISAGGDHTCALAAGIVYCWGGGGHGQLGTGTNPTSSSVPTAVSLPRKVTQVSAGWLHTCALTDTGEVYCWGANSSGQLGDGTTTNRNLPVKIESTLTFTSISAGQADHTCGVASNGQAYCWGSNTFGQMGDGSVGGTDRLVPAAVFGVKGFISISAGNAQNCAMKDADSSSAASTTPPTLPIIKQVYCWGSNSSGEVGTGTISPTEATPALVSVYQKPAGKIIFLSAGYHHTCVRTNRQTTFCWGNNASGQIGNGKKINRSKPTLVVGLP